MHVTKKKRVKKNITKKNKLRKNIYYNNKNKHKFDSAKIHPASIILHKQI